MRIRVGAEASTSVGQESGCIMYRPSAETDENLPNRGLNTKYENLASPSILTAFWSVLTKLNQILWNVD